MAILSKGCKPDNFESHNSLKLSFMDISGLCLNFVEFDSFLVSNSPDILALCETNLDDSIDSGNFSVAIYLPLIQKDSTTHMYSHAVCVKQGLPLAGDLSLQNCVDFLLMFLTGFNLLSVLLLFPLSITFVFVYGFRFTEFFFIFVYVVYLFHLA